MGVIMYRYELFIGFDWSLGLSPLNKSTPPREKLKEIKDWCYQNFGDEGDRWVVETKTKLLDELHIFKIKYDKDGLLFAMRWA